MSADSEVTITPGRPRRSSARSRRWSIRATKWWYSTRPTTATNPPCNSPAGVACTSAGAAGLLHRLAAHGRGHRAAYPAGHHQYPAQPQRRADQPRGTGPPGRVDPRPGYLPDQRRGLRAPGVRRCRPYQRAVHDELYPRSFVVSSFGKTYHVTGWKTGYVVAPPALSAELRKVHQYVNFCGVTPLQWALADYMAGHPEHLRQLPGFYQAKRDLFCDLLLDSLPFHPCAGHLLPVRGLFGRPSGPGRRGHGRVADPRTRVAAIPVSVFYERRRTPCGWSGSVTPNARRRCVRQRKSYARSDGSAGPGHRPGQSSLAWHDAQANREHFAALLESAAGADLVVLPEMFTTGFSMASAEQAEPELGRPMPGCWSRPGALVRWSPAA